MASNPSEYMLKYMQEYRKENKDIISKAQKNWRDKNKDYHKEYMRQYRAKKKSEKLALA